MHDERHVVYGHVAAVQGDLVLLGSSLAFARRHGAAGLLLAAAAQLMRQLLGGEQVPACVFEQQTRPPAVLFLFLLGSDVFFDGPHPLSVAFFVPPAVVAHGL